VTTSETEAHLNGLVNIPHTLNNVAGLAQIIFAELKQIIAAIDINYKHLIDDMSGVLSDTSVHAVRSIFDELKYDIYLLVALLATLLLYKYLSLMMERNMSVNTNIALKYG
jgi:hypothetical protein